MTYRQKARQKFDQLMTEDESFTSTGLLAGAMSLITLFMVVSITLYSAS